MSQDRQPPRVFTSHEQFCRFYFPKHHAARECRCYPPKDRGVLIIQPRSGRQIRRV